MAIISISDSQVNSADQILVADSNSKIPAKDGSQITILNATNISSGTIASARLDTGTPANKLVLLDGSGNLPAVDASLLTGIVSATISASDPTISTNPSGGLGTEWLNSTSGEMYILTDATAGANVWTNVGAGSGNIDPWAFQGTSYGYTCGGTSPVTNIIDKYSFTSDANATDVGDMLYGAQGMCGGKSTTYGYGAGGEPSKVDINKFPLASDSNATDVGDLAVGRNSSASCFTNTHGYMGGGYIGSSTNTNQIERNSFASDGNSVDTTQDLFESIYNNSGTNSSTHGYSAGGHTTGWTNTIQKFQFDTSNAGTDVGNLLTATGGSTGSSSTTYGYEVGGYPGNTNQIEKYSYSSDGNSVDVADLDSGIASGGGTEY